MLLLPQLLLRLVDFLFYGIEFGSTDLHCQVVGAGAEICTSTSENERRRKNLSF